MKTKDGSTDKKRVGLHAGTSRGTAAKPALPLKGRRMFLQLQGYAAATRLEQDLLLLGGTVEKCFSREVNCVLTNRGCPADYEKKRKKRPAATTSVSVPSPVTPSPFNLANLGVDSPHGYSPSSVEPQKPLTRGKAMMQAAKSTKMYGTMDVLEAARAWNLKVVHLDRVLPWMKREIEKLPQSARSKQDDPVKKSLMKVRKLRGSYIKFEATNCGFRPLYREFKQLPAIHFETAPWTCPFNNKKQNSKIDEHGEGEEEREPQGVPEELLELDASPEPAVHKDPQLPCRKPDGADEFFGVHVLTAGEVRHMQQERKRADMKRGYCEMCAVKYDNIDKHIYNTRHREFVANNNNYEALDKMIAGGPNMAQFMADVVQAHSRRNCFDCSSIATMCLDEVMLLSEGSSPGRSKAKSRPIRLSSNILVRDASGMSVKPVSETIKSEGKAARTVVKESSKLQPAEACAKSPIKVTPKKTRRAAEDVVQSPPRKSKRTLIKESPKCKSPLVKKQDVLVLVPKLLIKETQMSSKLNLDALVRSPSRKPGRSVVKEIPEWQNAPGKWKETPDILSPGRLSDARTSSLEFTPPHTSSRTRKPSSAIKSMVTKAVLSAGQCGTPLQSVSVSGTPSVDVDVATSPTTRNLRRSSRSNTPRRGTIDTSNASSRDASPSVKVRKKQSSKFWFYEDNGSEADLATNQVMASSMGLDVNRSDTADSTTSSKVCRKSGSIASDEPSSLIGHSSRSRSKRRSHSLQNTNQNKVSTTSSQEHTATGVVSIQMSQIKQSDCKAKPSHRRLSCSRSTHGYSPSRKVCDSIRAACSEQESSSSENNKPVADSNSTSSVKTHRRSNSRKCEGAISESEVSAHPSKKLFTVDENIGTKEAPTHPRRDSINVAISSEEPGSSNNKIKIVPKIDGTLRVVCPKLNMKEIMKCQNSQTLAVSVSSLQAFRTSTLWDGRESGPVRRVRSARSVGSQSARSTPASSQVTLTDTESPSRGKQLQLSVDKLEHCESSTNSDLLHTDDQAAPSAQQTSLKECSDDDVQDHGNTGTPRSDAHLCEGKHGNSQSALSSLANGKHTTFKEDIEHGQPISSVVNKSLKTSKAPEEFSKTCMSDQSTSTISKIKRKWSMGTNKSRRKKRGMSDETEDVSKRSTKDSKELPSDTMYEDASEAKDLGMSDASNVTNESQVVILSQGLDCECSSPVPENAVVTPIKKILGNVNTQILSEASSTGWDDNLDEFLQGTVNRLTTEDGNTSVGYTPHHAHINSSQRSPHKVQCKLVHSPFKFIESPLGGLKVKTPQRLASPQWHTSSKESPQDTNRTLDFASPSLSLLAGMNSEAEELWIGPTKNEKFIPSYMQKSVERSAHRNKPGQRTPVYHMASSPLVQCSTPKSSLKSPKTAAVYDVPMSPAPCTKHSVMPHDKGSHDSLKPKSRPKFLKVIDEIVDLPTLLTHEMDTSPNTHTEKNALLPKRLLTDNRQASPSSVSLQSCIPSTSQLDEDMDMNTEIPKKKLLKTISSIKKRVSLGFIPAYDFNSRKGRKHKTSPSDGSGSSVRSGEVRLSNLGRSVTPRVGSLTPLSSRSSAKMVDSVKLSPPVIIPFKPPTTSIPITPHKSGSVIHKEIGNQPTTPVLHSLQIKQKLQVTPIQSSGVKKISVSAPSSCTSTPQNRQLDKLLSLHSLENLQFLPRRKSSNVFSIVRFHNNGLDSDEETPSRTSSDRNTPKAGGKNEQGSTQRLVASRSAVTPTGARIHKERKRSNARVSSTLSLAKKSPSPATHFPTKNPHQKKFWYYEPISVEIIGGIDSSPSTSAKRRTKTIFRKVPAETDSSAVKSDCTISSSVKHSHKTKFWYYEPLSDETNSENDSNDCVPGCSGSSSVKACRRKKWNQEALSDKTKHEPATSVYPSSSAKKSRNCGLVPSDKPETDLNASISACAASSATALRRNKFWYYEALPDSTHASEAAPSTRTRRNRSSSYTPLQATADSNIKTFIHDTAKSNSGKATLRRRSETLTSATGTEWLKAKAGHLDSRPNTSSRPKSAWTKSKLVDMSRSNRHIRSKSAVILATKFLRKVGSPSHPTSPVSESSISVQCRSHISYLRRRLIIDSSPPKQARLRSSQQECRLRLGRTAKGIVEAKNDDS